MKRNFLKSSLLIALSTVFALSVAGCGATPVASTAPTTAAATAATTAKAAEATTAEATTAAAADEKYAETVTLSLLMDNQSGQDGINALTAAIKEKYNIETVIELRPGGAEGDNLMKTRLATGEMTDIALYNSGSLLSALNPAENFIDITNEPFMANVVDSYKKAVTVDGKVYGVAYDYFMGGGWFYNKKVYAELGLSVPKTWSELMSNCDKVKAADKTAVIGSYQDSWTAQLLILADYYNLQAEVPNFADDYTNNKAKFASTPAALKGFEKLAEVNTKGYLNEDFLSTTYDIALEMLATGAGAHYPMLTFAIPQIATNFPDSINDIGFFAQPGDTAEKSGLTVWAPGAAYLNKKGSNVEAELKWASFACSVDGANAYASGVKPTGPSPIVGATMPDDVFPAVKDMLPYFENGNNAPALEFLSPIKGPNLPQICVEAGAGIKTPAECAANYDKDVEKQAKQLGIAGW